MQLNKVSGNLQVGRIIAQVQNKNQAVREEEKSWCEQDEHHIGVSKQKHGLYNMKQSCFYV